MTDKVYSFTKVRKQHTKAGEYALATGIISLAVLVFFIGFGVWKKGQMAGVFCLIPYVTMIASAIGMFSTKTAIVRTYLAGKYLHAGHRICMVSLVLHLLILLIGILKIIL